MLSYLYFSYLYHRVNSKRHCNITEYSDMNKENENKNAGISARIKGVIDFFKDTPNGFAIKLGYKRSQTVYDILSAKSAPSYDFFNRFINAGFSDKINMDWLIGGKGGMLKDEEVAIQEPQLAISADIQRIPIVDLSVAAGSGYINLNYVEEIDSIAMPVTMLKNGKQYLCVRVKGHSMLPSILDGGYLVIRMLDRSEWEGIRDNYVYVVSDVEGKAYVKRLKNRLKQHGFIVCMSDNADKQNYPNFNLYEEELHTIWYAEWYFSAKIPNVQNTFYRKQAEFEDRLEELSNQLQQIQKALNSNN